MSANAHLQNLQPEGPETASSPVPRPGFVRSTVADGGEAPYRTDLCVECVRKGRGVGNTRYLLTVARWKGITLVGERVEVL